MIHRLGVKETVDAITDNMLQYIHQIYFQYLADPKISKNWVAQSVVRKFKFRFNTDHLNELVKRQQWPVRLSAKQKKNLYYNQHV